MNAESLKQEILERGYWKIILQPTSYPTKKFSGVELKNLIKECRVTNRSFEYPSIIDHNNLDWAKYYTISNGIESWMTLPRLRDLFRFYESGQFIQYLGMYEDRFEERSNFTNTKIVNQSHPPEIRFFETTWAMCSFTEIFLFASNLSQKNVFGDRIKISISLHNQANRILKTLDPFRVGFNRQYECHDNEINLTPLQLSIDDLQSNHDEFAIQNMMACIKLFNYDSDHIEASFREDQKKFYDRQY